MPSLPRPRLARAARTVVLAVAGPMLVISAMKATTTTTVPPNPRQLFASAIAAAKTESAVHWVSHVRSRSYSISLVTTAGMADGTQSMTVRSGSQTGHVSAILIGPVAYVLGDEVGLRAVLYFSPTAASQEAGRWLVLASAATGPQSERQLYDEVSSGLTISSIIAAIDLNGTSSLVPGGSVGGRAVLGVRVSVPAAAGTSTTAGTPGTTAVAGAAGAPASSPSPTQEVLYLRASGLPLPVKVVLTSPHVTSTVVFGPWGHAPDAQVPVAAVPFQVAWQ